MKQGEIKFRAWDKADKKMVYTEDIEGDYEIADDECCREYTNIVLPNIFENSYLVVSRFPCHPFEMQTEEYDGFVMRYSGLTDRLGKNIYEGDILKTFNILEKGEKTPLTIVYFDEEYAQFGERFSDGTELVGGVGYECIDTNNVLVIGNIYDNPELLPNMPK